jgi:hypothetical protein
MFESFKSNILFAFVAASLLANLISCTAYQSGGRRVIAENQNGILNGLSTTPLSYYTCSTSIDEPDFLKEPLDVIETPFEDQNFSVLHNADHAPDWVAIHRFNETLNRHEQCKIYFLGGHLMQKHELTLAAKLGVNKILIMSERAYHTQPLPR